MKRMAAKGPQNKGSTMNRLLASVAMIATLSTPVFAQDADTVLATVDGTEITLGHMIAMRTRLPQQYQDLPDDVLYNGMLDQLIQQEIMAAAARKDLSKLQDLGLENEMRAFLAGQMIDATASEPVAETDVQAAYDAQFATAAPQPEFNAAHILVETEEEAQSLVTQLAEGGDFAELAKTYSTGPSGPNGGELGWFGLGQMVPAFEQAVLTMDAGDVSAPVQTQFGWHVVLLKEKRERGAPALEEVRGTLEETLRSSAVDKMVEDLTAGATVSRAEVQVDPALIRNNDLLSE
jgi:peptidyl-prolyl cis-trans isomerase C